MTSSCQRCSGKTSILVMTEPVENWLDMIGIDDRYGQKIIERLAQGELRQEGDEARPERNVEVQYFLSIPIPVMIGQTTERCAVHWVLVPNLRTCRILCQSDGAYMALQLVALHVHDIGLWIYSASRCGLLDNSVDCYTMHLITHSMRATVETSWEARYYSMNSLTNRPLLTGQVHHAWQAACVLAHLLNTLHYGVRKSTG